LHSVFPFSSRSPARKPGVATTTFAQGLEATSAAPDVARQALQVSPEPNLVWLEASDSDRPTRNRRQLAPSRIQAVLEVDFSTQDERWAKTHKQGTARLDIPHGRGEP
jgi:hypothetical protein